jgi:hypothetical protein
LDALGQKTASIIRPDAADDFGPIESGRSYSEGLSANLCHELTCNFETFKSVGRGRADGVSDDVAAWMQSYGQIWEQRLDRLEDYLENLVETEK